MLYDYLCMNCGHQEERHNKIDERKTNAPVCCGEPMNIVILKAPMGFVDNMEAYKCVATGEVITSRRQRRYVMEKGDYIDANDFKKTPEQRRAEKAKKQAELKAIRDEIPAELQAAMKTEIKREADKFKASGK